MSFSSLSILQFAELQELLAGYAGSDGGRALVYALEPHSDRAALEAALADFGVLAVVRFAGCDYSGECLHEMEGRELEVRSSLKVVNG